MVSILELSDSIFKDETLSHSIRVSKLCYRFGEYLGYDESCCELLGLGGLLHDIGKFYISKDILYKRGLLNQEEQSIIRGHVSNASLALNFEEMNPILVEMITQHHERLDGLGYPHGITSAEIHPYAKILSIVDAYDAITHSRSYRADYKSIEDAIEMMYQQGIFTQFEQSLLVKFESFIVNN